MPQTETVDRVATRTGEEPEVEISIKNLTKTFGPQTVFDDISFDIPRGKITLILGPSGTGKSVFLKHVMGLLKPDHGEIWIDGKNVPALSHRDLYKVRRKFGVLFQDGALFGSMSIYDNVAFPLREHTKKGEKEIREIVTEKLEMVGLRGAEKKLPGQISGGMKKRAGLARALVLDPDIIMFDEPDSGLDPVRTAFLNELILDLSDKLASTIIVVTHDIATARRIADYIGMLYARHLVKFGPARAMFDSDIPVVRQFLAGDTDGPIGMSEEADRTKAVSTSGLSAEETEELEREAGAPEEEEWRRRQAERAQRDERSGAEGDGQARRKVVPIQQGQGQEEQDREEPGKEEREISDEDAAESGPEEAEAPAARDEPTVSIFDQQDDRAEAVLDISERPSPERGATEEPPGEGVDEDDDQSLLSRLHQRYATIWKRSGGKGAGG